MKTPLLIYSDCPEGKTGLGRITRDLATHIYSDPDINEQFEVGTYGYGAIGSRHTPWKQYTARNLDCIHPDLKRVWEDFSQGREGILMPILPPSWMFGLVHPELALKENPKIEDTVNWIKSKPFQIWPYLAVESCGPGMKFNAATCSTIVQCQKPLFYSRFGQKVAENSNIMNVPFIHHGIYTSQFRPASKEVVEDIRINTLKCDSSSIVIGCVATNTGRKRLGTLFAAFQHFHEVNPNSKLWLHTDSLLGAWNIPELSSDYGFDKTDSIAWSLTNAYCDDEWMRNFYSSCDVTVLPTYGEGFGYPIVESQACGTPCVTGSFACEAELTTPDLAVSYRSVEADGIHNLLRPHYSPVSFSDALQMALERPTDGIDELIRQRWDWEIQWPKFKEWLLK